MIFKGCINKSAIQTNVNFLNSFSLASLSESSLLQIWNWTITLSDADTLCMRECVLLNFSRGNDWGNHHRQTGFEEIDSHPKKQKISKINLRTKSITSNRFKTINLNVSDALNLMEAMIQQYQLTKYHQFSKWSEVQSKFYSFFLQKSVSRTQILSVHHHKTNS